MGYHRSKNRIDAAQAWAMFVAANRKSVEAAKLPPEVTESIEHWDDFLKHGGVIQNCTATGDAVDQLSETQYAALLQFVESYFARGYEYFTPVVLRAEDFQRLDMRYIT